MLQNNAASSVLSTAYALGNHMKITSAAFELKATKNTKDIIVIV